jgi:hypothetical protein
VPRCSIAFFSARLAHAAFEDVGDPQLSSDIADVNGLALELKSRIPGDHLKGRNLRQVRRDVFADAVAEIFLLAVTAHVLEGKDAHRQLPL